MATELHYRDGGAWRKAKELHYRDAGTWRKVKEAWYRDGGVWQKFFSSGEIINPLPIPSSVEVIALSPADARARIDMLSNGQISVFGIIGVETYNWFLPTVTGIGGSYWVRMRQVSGEGPNLASDTVGSWLPLSTSRSWSWSVTSNSGGLRAGVVVIEISTSSGGTPVVAESPDITFTASVEI